MSFGDKIIQFYQKCEIKESLPKGVEILNPYRNLEPMKLTKDFFHKFYNDENERVFLIGINPGRLGAGSTGIGFTDPVFLDEVCGIKNNLEKKHELSSKFIYAMIQSLGTAEDFYSRFFFTSVSPLGFTKDGKNLNYYDIKDLQSALEPFMVESLREQISFGSKNIAYSLGQGKNHAYLEKINNTHQLFDEIKPLPHPRWIMQYRLKRLEEFIGLYREELSIWS